MNDALEFASAAWLEALSELLPIYASQAGPDLELTICEVFTGVPAHLDRNGNGVIAWHCRIAGGVVHFEETERNDCDFKTVVDYQTVLPIARWIVTDENRPEYEALVARAAASGKAKPSGDTSRIPPSFMGMHNDLAARTL
ncbi:MAG: hypothetical protein ACRED9_07415 [Caulobacteraceae bacterium]